ncbi:hypothetical protein M1D89_01590 (plasmid) [Arthrobacter sp. D3-18]
MATQHDSVGPEPPSTNPLNLSSSSMGLPPAEAIDARTSTPVPVDAGRDSFASLSGHQGPLLRHNPVTEQLVMVGKRRERAEARLEDQLRAT